MTVDDLLLLEDLAGERGASAKDAAFEAVKLLLRNAAEFESETEKWEAALDERDAEIRKLEELLEENGIAIPRPLPEPKRRESVASWNRLPEQPRLAGLAK